MNTLPRLLLQGNIGVVAQPCFVLKDRESRNEEMRKERYLEKGDLNTWREGGKYNR